MTDVTINRTDSIQDGNFFNYLSSAYEVLKKIFSYLSLEDLETVSKVFEGWKSVAETIKKERSFIQCFVLYSVTQKIEMWSEAALGLTFTFTKNNEIEKRLKKHLTKDAQFLVVEARAGIIGPYNHPLFLLPQQKKFSKSSRASGSTKCPAVHLRLPNFSGVGIKIFSWHKNISFQEFKDSFSLPENQTIKCLLILMTVHQNEIDSSEQKDDFVAYLKTVQSDDFAVGGCLIDYFSEDVITKYIVFYGDKVDAASIVIEKTVITEKAIDQAVQELKQISPKTDRGVIFVFRCCSRNGLYRNSLKKVTQWESLSIFKYFPNTTVIGCYGYGEFGKKFPEENKLQSSTKIPRESNIWEYSYSTSVVYVGFKH